MCPGTGLCGEILPGSNDPLDALGILQVYFPLLDRLESMDESPKYWFNTKTSQVEYGHKSLALNRVGPFDTHEDASRALEILAARARQMREQEEAED
jgi:hypothetical protein